MVEASKSAADEHLSELALTEEEKLVLAKVADILRKIQFGTAGLVEPTSGQALLDGRPITGPGPDRAVLFQEPALFPWLSVRGNVELGLDLIGVPLSERRAVAQRWLANVHLEGWADAQPHELSAGMRQ